MVGQLSPASGAALFQALRCRLAAEEAAHETTRQALAAAASQPVVIDMPPSGGSLGGPSARLSNAKSALRVCASGCAAAFVNPDRPLWAVLAVLTLAPFFFLGMLLALVLASPFWAWSILVDKLPRKWLWWLPTRWLPAVDHDDL